jgi:hypothetical protein
MLGEQITVGQLTNKEGDFIICHALVRFFIICHTLLALLLFATHYINSLLICHFPLFTDLFFFFTPKYTTKYTLVPLDKRIRSDRSINLRHQRKKIASRETAGLERRRRPDIARTATFLPAATTYNTPTMTAEEVQSCRSGRSPPRQIKSSCLTQLMSTRHRSYWSS